LNDIPRPKLFSRREHRLLLYLAVVLAVAAWKYIPRRWTPTLTIQTNHYVVASTATPQQTEEVARVAEVLYATYSNLFSALPTYQSNHPKLQLRLYRDRQEIRRIHRDMSWAEAFYRHPICHAYYSADEVNPCAWMVHEMVHQLNREVADLNLEHWLEEGVGEYFSTSQIQGTKIALGRFEYNTYPLWWLDELATAPELPANLQNGSVIPLRAIVTGTGGPSLDQHFNLSYLHWWALTHFIFESDAHRENAIKLVQSGGDLASFEKLVGPLDAIEVEWHRYVRQVKAGTLLPVKRKPPE
jgi:hypothetical protein